ncbi:TPA: hypothetical protein WH791_001581, partial [Neisseria meningitidis]
MKTYKFFSRVKQKSLKFMEQWHRAMPHKAFSDLKNGTEHGTMAQSMAQTLSHKTTKRERQTCRTRLDTDITYNLQNSQTTSAPRYFQPADLNSITSFPIDSDSDNPSLGFQFGVLKIQFWCEVSPSFVDDRHRRFARGIFSAM